MTIKVAPATQTTARGRFLVLMQNTPPGPMTRWSRSVPFSDRTIECSTLYAVPASLVAWPRPAHPRLQAAKHVPRYAPRAIGLGTSGPAQPGEAHLPWFGLGGPPGWKRGRPRRSVGGLLALNKDARTSCRMAPKSRTVRRRSECENGCPTLALPATLKAFGKVSAP